MITGVHHLCVIDNPSLPAYGWGRRTQSPLRVSPSNRHVFGNLSSSVFILLLLF